MTYAITEVTTASLLGPQEFVSNNSITLPHSNMTKSYCLFICMQICDEFHNIVLLQLRVPDTKLELQNISLTAFLVLDISSTYFGMRFDMVLVFGVLRCMQAKYTVLDSLSYPDSLRREQGSRHTKVMWPFPQRTKLGPKGFGQMQFPHEKWGDHLINQTNEPPAIHSTDRHFCCHGSSEAAHETSGIGASHFWKWQDIGLSEF